MTPGPSEDKTKKYALLSETEGGIRPSELRPPSVHSGRSPSPDGRGQNFGLQVLFAPDTAAQADIIFVHGLGGDRQKTWSKRYDLSFFWPRLWLPMERDINTTRILTFGYNAGVRGGPAKSIARIVDFAKELLFEMKFGKDEYGEDLNLGRVPIIFIVHSMGGLVFKKAYILGKDDEEYQAIIQSISGVMFLATPHRGTNLAEVLNRMLSISIQSPKNFINELSKSSPALEDLNEQFRHVAPKLDIVSFYETLATAVGPMKLLVLEKDSSILGFPKEVSKSLNANHHEVCKFSSPQDSNYVSVRNALSHLLSRCWSKVMAIQKDHTLEVMGELRKLFGIYEASDDDFTSFRRRWVPGTCEWMLSQPHMKAWLGKIPESSVLWFTAPPASGKSVAATYIINHLQERGNTCLYFFFKFGDQAKRTLNMLLRSIAFQIATQVPCIRNPLLELSSAGLNFEKTDARIIWQRVFEAHVFSLSLKTPLFWVIDGLDESESPRDVLTLLSSINNSNTPVRVLIISRETEALVRAFDKLSNTMKVDIMEQNGRDHSGSDIQLLVEKELKHMRGSRDLKERISNNVLGRAEGNFLWVRLVLEEVLDCHTEQDILEILEEIPSDMSELYRRMDDAIANNPKQSDQLLAQTLLQWTTCARRPLFLLELAQALQPEFPQFLDLKRTIQDVCKQFILVDHNSRVALVHQTARDYLTKTPDSSMFIDLKKGHERLFTRIMGLLLEPHLRLRMAQGKTAVQIAEPLLVYAATCWPYHLRHMNSSSEKALSLLFDFFSSTAVLTWAQTLAMLGEIEIFVKAAKTLTTFVGLRRKENASKNPLLHRIGDIDFLEKWAVDLVRIAGKFSGHLLSDPSSIYKLIPPFCPDQSIIHMQFYKESTADIRIYGIINTSWSDSLAKMSLLNNEQAWEVASSSRYLAVLSSSGAVTIRSSFNFVEICGLQHNESVTAMCFNGKGDKFMTYGMKTTKLWSIPSGQLLFYHIQSGRRKSHGSDICKGWRKYPCGL